ncbi:MAG: DUF1566 domain-containing protein [Epsilonproteobacteria bacterium]|nr:DUF1566 domain-containing protein [Campylobacterota bacterium]
MKLINFFIALLGVIATILGTYYTYKQYLIAKEEHKTLPKPKPDKNISSPNSQEKSIEDKNKTKTIKPNKNKYETKQYVIFKNTIWQKETSKEQKSYFDAQKSCEQLGKNWRLPTKEEIKKLSLECNPSKCPKKNIIFHSEFPHKYWTINLDKKDKTKGYVFEFNDKSFDSLNVETLRYYICIKGGVKK